VGIILYADMFWVLRHAFLTNRVVNYSVVNIRIRAVEEIIPRGGCVL